MRAKPYVTSSACWRFVRSVICEGLVTCTLKRVYKFFHCNLILYFIFVQLVFDILCYRFCVFSGRVHIISSALELSIPIFVLQICMPFINYQSTFSLRNPTNPDTLIFGGMLTNIWM